MTITDKQALDQLHALITAEGQDTDLGSDFIGDAVAIVQATGRDNTSGPVIGDPAHLHIGVKTTALLRVCRWLTANGYLYVIDGDGWEAWGEAAGTDRNDNDTLHVIVVIDGIPGEDLDGSAVKDAAFRVVTALEAQRVLTPAIHSAMMIGQVTDADDWTYWRDVEQYGPTWFWPGHTPTAQVIEDLTAAVDRTR